MNSPEGDDILLEMVSHIFEPSRGWLMVGYHFSPLNLEFGGLAEYPEQIRQLFKTQSVSEVPLELSQTNRVGLGLWRLKRNQEAADPWLLTHFFGGKHEVHGDGTFTERNYYQGGLGGSNRLWKDACLNQRIMEISQWGGRLAGELSRSFASLSRCWNVVPKGLHSQRIAPGGLQTIEAAPANWWLHYVWWVTLLEDMWNWSRWMSKFNLRSLWGKASQLWCLISLLFRGIPWGMAWPPQLRTGSTKYVSTTSILAIKSWCFLDGNRMAIPTWASYWVEHHIFWRLWAILRGTTTYDEQWNQMKCWLKKKHASNHRPWWMAYWYLVFGVYLCNVWARYSPNLVLSISRGSWIWFKICCTPRTDSWHSLSHDGEKQTAFFYVWRF